MRHIFDGTDPDDRQRTESDFAGLVRKLQTPRRGNGPFGIDSPEVWEEPDPAAPPHRPTH